jgi:hypothetical protein
LAADTIGTEAARALRGPRTGCAYGLRRGDRIDASGDIGLGIRAGGDLSLRAAAISTASFIDEDSLQNVPGVMAPNKDELARMKERVGKSGMVGFSSEDYFAGNVPKV